MGSHAFVPYSSNSLASVRVMDAVRLVVCSVAAQESTADLASVVAKVDGCSVCVCVSAAPASAAIVEGCSVVACVSEAVLSTVGLTVLGCSVAAQESTAATARLCEVLDGCSVKVSVSVTVAAAAIEL